MEFPPELTDEEMLLHVKEWQVAGLSVVLFEAMVGRHAPVPVTEMRLKSSWEVEIYKPQPMALHRGQLLATYKGRVVFQNKSRAGIWDLKEE